MHRVRPTSTRLLSQAAKSSHLNIQPRTCRHHIHPTVTTSTQAQQTRALFNLFNKLTGRTPKNSGAAGTQAPKEPILSQDNLFHPLSRSPFPAVRARGETIANVAPCPVCTSEHAHSHASTASDAADPDQPSHKPEEGQLKQKKKLAFECPDCGFPTHCSEEHWRADTEHDRYCARLREVNEDEHDLRSGRRIREFEFPGEQDSEAAVSFSNWDVFWYTRQFPSMDTERARRHASKILTYPLTIASILHQYSGLTLSNQRLTPEGSRSLAALRSTLHVKPGTPETPEQAADKPQVRVFILGVRSESALPAHVWEQLTMLFPAAQLHLHFIGPQVSLPKAKELYKDGKDASTGGTQDAKTDAPAPEESSNSTSTTDLSAAPPPQTSPTTYTPPPPPSIPALKRTRSSVPVYGVPSYTTPYTPALTLTGLNVPSYIDVHAQFQDTFDPYTDVFFMFHPGLGFPSPEPTSVDANGQPLLQIASPTEWGPVMPLLLASKCPIFITGFSPADVERDVKALATAPGVAGEFDWLLTPGPNAFGSEKWEAADFDPRVMVRTNWGVWGIRGKRRDVRKREGVLGSVFGA